MGLPEENGRAVWPEGDSGGPDAVARLGVGLAPGRSGRLLRGALRESLVSTEGHSCRVNSKCNRLTFSLSGVCACGRSAVPCGFRGKSAIYCIKDFISGSPGANPESLLPGSPSWEGAGVCGRGRRTDAGQPEARAKASHAARAAGRSALEPRVPFAGSKDDLRG
ncbi:uncharacterized protein LOC122202180 isoform X2 [Panthera leo]|uniref:uncharacterized protein LOC122202180 isoform X2 n=1 Tax=Panthera leo TaxID=9689 RepID=UPI001C69B9C0|nr:uncharacterized protein LOC122202180 isoform X2 [Panthera leo]